MWPLDGAPLTDVVLLARDLEPGEHARLMAARRVRTYCGGGIVFRDPELPPHVPRRRVTRCPCGAPLGPDGWCIFAWPR